MLPYFIFPLILSSQSTSMSTHMPPLNRKEIVLEGQNWQVEQKNHSDAPLSTFSWKDLHWAECVAHW